MTSRKPAPTLPHDPRATGRIAKAEFTTIRGCAALPAVSRTAGAQTYPSPPVKIIDGFARVNVSTRVIAQWLSERLGQPVAVEIRPGASINNAAEAVVHAPADGYTLLLVDIANATNATLYDNLNFNFIRDIAPIAGIYRGGAGSVMAVHPSFPAKTVAEFIAYAKANPGKLTLASSFSGSPTYFAAALFKVMAGIDIPHVPYPSDAQGIGAILDGKVQVIFSGSGGAREYIRSGKLRPLAVGAASRSSALPDVPAIGEFVPGYEYSGWQGLGAPKNTPTEIIDTLNKAINAGFADPKVMAGFAEVGVVPMPMTPAEFGKFIADETEKWGKVIRAANIKAE
jgi:tripartite-type tricarboxylate transporter receptor subunit TctC